MQSLSLNQIKAESAQYEDYVPFAANKVKTNVFNHQISINGHKSYLKGTELSPGYQQETYYLRNLKNKQSRIVLPFFIYNHKDYTAYVNGKKTKLYVTKKSLAQIYVRDTKNAIITIRYTTPLIYIMVRIVSLLMVIILIVGMLVILLKRENKDD